ncbi:zf-HC2 domain-containing protein [candidate division KSB1 bacterium]|nr:zf-HC2 domain-containing protein [candidate division KSB1 bacterium]
MKTCRKIQKRFIEALYNELDESHAAAFHQHLQNCRDCRQQYEQMKSTLDVMSQKQQEEPEPVFWSGYWTRLAARMQRENDRSLQSSGYRRVSAFRRWSYQAAGAIALVLIGIFIGYLYFGRPIDRQIAVNEKQDQMNANLQSIAINQQALHFLERSKILLLGMVNLDTLTINAGQLDFAPQRQLSRKLITEAAAFKQQLQQPEYLRLLTLIQELEILLLQISNSENNHDLPAIEIIKTGVDNQGILLKIDLTEMMISDQLIQQNTKNTNPNKLTL